MINSLEIAQQAKLKPISDIAKKLGLSDDDIELHGKYIAKIALSARRKAEIMEQPQGKYILVTGVSPTPAGEGKTTTSIGLTQGLARLGFNAVATLRQPSLGPVFGIKGGAAGAGYSQVLPMEEINLGLTGDFAKIESAHNLLAAMIDNHIFRKNKLDFDLTTIQWRRVMDMNDRALREIVVGLGDPSVNGVARASGFDITAASEIMAILALASDLEDLKGRLGDIVIGRNRKGEIIRARDLRVHGAMAALLKHAIKPNLVQTIEGQPCIMHTGPFGNIAHGCSSVIGDRIALHLADYVVTEAGFGTDLGAEKFFDIKCRQSGLFPDVAVLVTTVRAMKYHGGVPYDKREMAKENVDAVREGCRNLEKHVTNLLVFGVPVIIALNRFPTDTEAEIEQIRSIAKYTGAAGFAVSNAVAEGGKGALDLAQLVVDVISSREKPRPKFLYELEDPIEAKIEKIGKIIYGAGGIRYTAKAEKKMKQLKADGFNDLAICMAKTHLSLSDRPELRGRPEGFDITIDDIRISAGAKFIYPIVGKMLTMPGLPVTPAAETIDIDAEGKITGLF